MAASSNQAKVDIRRAYGFIYLVNSGVEEQQFV